MLLLHFGLGGTESIVVLSLDGITEYFIRLRDFVKGATISIRLVGMCQQGALTVQFLQTSFRMRFLGQF